MTKFVNEICGYWLKFIELFLNFNLLTPIISFSLKPQNYIQEILVPETAMRLILEDLSGSNSLETAREVMIASSDFGKYVHNDKC